MSTLHPYCSDIPYPAHLGGPVRGCGATLVLVPDANRKAQTIACPRCDRVDWWPRIRKAGWRVKP